MTGIEITVVITPTFNPIPSNVKNHMPVETVQDVEGVYV